VLRFVLMRVYKFLDTKYGIDSTQKRRLKQSRVSDLNDPFELRSFDVTSTIIRETFRQTSEDVDKTDGLLCFSAGWENPVIWAHYSDKHKGLCLGFEIPDLAEDPNSNTGYVKYVPCLLPCPSLSTFEGFEKLPDSGPHDFAHAALFTKFEHWAYENEIRVWVPLGNEDSGLHFVPFGKDLQLKQVVLGQRCARSRADIVEALGALVQEVKIMKARAAYDKFQMVEDESWA